HFNLCPTPIREKNELLSLIRTEFQQQLIASAKHVRDIDKRIKDLKEIQEYLDKSSVALIDELEKVAVSLIQELPQIQNEFIDRIPDIARNLPSVSNLLKYMVINERGDIEHFLNKVYGYLIHADQFDSDAQYRLRERIQQRADELILN